MYVVLGVYVCMFLYHPQANPRENSVFHLFSCFCYVCLYISSIVYNMGASFMNFMFFLRPANCISVVLLNVVFLFVGKIKWWRWWCLFPHSTMSSPPRTFAATGILFRACPSVGAWVCESVRPENSRQNKTKNDTYCTIFYFIAFCYIVIYHIIFTYVIWCLGDNSRIVARWQPMQVVIEQCVSNILSFQL